jgi:hypothetical protein
MVIKNIEYKNMISNESEVKINFVTKLGDDINLFFEESIQNKKRSKISSKEGILKKIALHGKNASYKTSTLNAVNNILFFIINFKNNIDNFMGKRPDIDAAIN